MGDKFFLCENKILCESDYEERLVFANMAVHPPSTATLAQIKRQVFHLQPQVKIKKLNAFALKNSPEIFLRSIHRLCRPLGFPYNPRWLTRFDSDTAINVVDATLPLPMVPPQICMLTMQPYHFHRAARVCFESRRGITIRVVDVSAKVENSLRRNPLRWGEGWLKWQVAHPDPPRQQRTPSRLQLCFTTPAIVSRVGISRVLIN